MHLHTRSIGVHHKGTDATVPKLRIHLAECDEPACVLQVGDPHLGATEYVMISVFSNASFHARYVGSGTWLSHTGAGHHLAPGERRKILLFLVVRPIKQET